MQALQSHIARRPPEHWGAAPDPLPQRPAAGHHPEAQCARRRGHPPAARGGRRPLRHAAAADLEPGAADLPGPHGAGPGLLRVPGLRRLPCASGGSAGETRRVIAYSCCGAGGARARSPASAPPLASRDRTSAGGGGGAWLETAASLEPPRVAERREVPESRGRIARHTFPRSCSPCVPESFPGRSPTAGRAAGDRAVRLDRSSYRFRHGRFRRFLFALRMGLALALSKAFCTQNVYVSQGLSTWCVEGVVGQWGLEESRARVGPRIGLPNSARLRPMLARCRPRAARFRPSSTDLRRPGEAGARKRPARGGHDEAASTTRPEIRDQQRATSRRRRA